MPDARHPATTASGAAPAPAPAPGHADAYGPGPREAIRRQLQAALAAVGQDVALADLGDAVSLDVDLGVDSYHLTEVARHLEEAHALRFTLVDWVLAADESEAGYTVGSLLDYVAAQLAALTAPATTPQASLDPAP